MLDLRDLIHRHPMIRSLEQFEQLVELLHHRCGGCVGPAAQPCKFCRSGTTAPPLKAIRDTPGPTRLPFNEPPPAAP
jgi:hypothetical protein